MTPVPLRVLRRLLPAQPIVVIPQTGGLEVRAGRIGQRDVPIRNPCDVADGAPHEPDEFRYTRYGNLRLFIGRS